MLMQAFLVGLVSFVAACDGGYGSLYVARPIVLSPIIGLILGDLQSGLAIGATLELLFMGSISVGAYVPPDTNVGSVLATAFAISLGQGTDVAVALAMPIAVLALGLYNLLAAVMPFFLQFADKAAEEGNDRMLVSGTGGWASRRPSCAVSSSASASISVLSRSRAFSTSFRSSCSTAWAPRRASFPPWASPCSCA